jgi:hypothetical protein
VEGFVGGLPADAESGLREAVAALERAAREPSAEKLDVARSAYHRIRDYLTTSLNQTATGLNERVVARRRLEAAADHLRDVLRARGLPDEI